MELSSATAALPGFFLLELWKKNDGTPECLAAMPIVAWGISRNCDSQFCDDKWINAEPIGIDGGYANSVGILTPNGFVIQVGVQTWFSLREFMDEIYGKQLPVHGLEA